MELTAPRAASRRQIMSKIMAKALNEASLKAFLGDNKKPTTRSTKKRRNEL